MQIIVRSKLVQRRRMMDALIDQSGGVCQMLELVNEHPFLGSHDALRYLLWSIKKRDFAQMDKALARWVKVKSKWFSTLLSLYFYNRAN